MPLIHTVRRFVTFSIVLSVAVTTGLYAQTSSGAKKPARKSASAAHPLTQADVQRLWAMGDDTLLANQIRLKDVGFDVEEDWLLNQLPKATGVPPGKMPNSAALLKTKIQPAPDIDAVSAAAAALLDQIKAAAQQRNSAALEPLLHPDLFQEKGKVYDLFDVANYRGHTLGRFGAEPNRQVSVQFFELTTSNVERIYYVYFSQLRGGKLVMRDVKSGPEQDARFLHDEEVLAQDKLKLMFRALNDGDETGLKTLCTDGLYEAIKAWGGDKHPGDRLTRGRNLSQVTFKTSIQEQKAIRVVARISYPLANNKVVAFDVDFERIGNDLKIVRVRDTDNRVIVFDPNIDNYLNRRYALPDTPAVSDVATTEQEVFFSSGQLQQKAIQALQDHNAQHLKDLAQTLVDSDPTGGIGYGLLAGANEILGNFDDANRNAGLALQHSGTVYYVVERHSATQNQPFTPVILAISKNKIDYIPATGLGAPEQIDVSSIKEDKIDMNHNKFNPLKSDRPFATLVFVAADGKKKTYNFAAYGTQCQPGPNLQPVADPSGTCGLGGGSAMQNTTFNPFGKGSSALPMYVPITWQRDLSEVLRAIDIARGK